MGWLDDLLTIGGGAAGGTLGFFAGGPSGALAGASLGSGFGNWLGSKLDDNGAGAEAQKIAQMYDSLQYTDPMSNPDYRAEMQQLQQYSTGALTPEDKARELEALNQAGMMAKGREGAIEQEQAARGQGVANAGMAGVDKAVEAQGAAGRLSAADTATMGMAAQRALQANQEFLRQMSMNDQMQNQFALAKAGGSTQANLAYLNYLGAQQAAQQQALTGFAGGLAKMAVPYAFGGAPSPTASGGDFQGGGSPANVNLADFASRPPTATGSPDAGASFTSFLNGGMPVDQGSATAGAPSTEAVTADEAATQKRRQMGFQ